MFANDCFNFTPAVCRLILPLLVLSTSIVSGCASVGELQEKTQQAWVQERAKADAMPKRVYLGGGLGSTTLSPNTESTSYEVDNKKSSSSQMRIGIDVHPAFSVELDTQLLGSASLRYSDQDVSYTSATLSTVFYGLGGRQNRYFREGFNAYGRLGYAVLQRTSDVDALDHSDQSFVIGAGAEYGFRNGFAIRAEATRTSSDANQISLGGIIRLGATRTNAVRIAANSARNTKESQPMQADGLAMRVQNYSPSAKDADGDGVTNKYDVCNSTMPDTTVNNQGCGLFDAVLSDVQFKSGSYWLSPKARGQLDVIAQSLLAFPEARIEIGAHSDSLGDAALNLELSKRRAQSVASYLQTKQVNQMQLVPVGFGAEFPVADNATEEGRRKNRRIELITLPNISAEEIASKNLIAEVDDDKKRTVTPERMRLLNQKVAQFEIVEFDKQKGINTASASLTASNDQSQKALSEVVEASQSASAEDASAQNVMPDRANLPPISAMKIQPLPAPGEVFGFHLAGPLKGVDFVEQSATLTESAKNELLSVLDQLEKFPEVRISVMGHVDDRGDDDQNLLDSAQRARAVVAYLVSLGIAPERLMSEGYGSELPLVQELTSADKKRNQRIEIRVLED